MDSIKIKRTIIFPNDSDKWNCVTKGVRTITIAHTNNKMGISICNPKDKHIKKVGTELATKRLLENPIELPQDLSKLDYAEIIVIALTIVKSKMLTTITCSVV